MIVFIPMQALAQENHQEAVACMQRCKDMLLRLPKEVGYKKETKLWCYFDKALFLTLPILGRYIQLLSPPKTGYLSLMCYNFGVDSYNMKKYEESSFWLR